MRKASTSSISAENGLQGAWRFGNSPVNAKEANPKRTDWGVGATLEAQQRYFSYRAILATIVAQNYFVHAFVGITHLSRDMVQKGVSHRCACVKLSTNGGYRTMLGGC